MEYRSYADLTRAVTNGLWRVPADVDLVVAIPRSGIVPATVIALGLNVPTTDVDGLLSDRLIASGHTRRLRRPVERVSDCRHALVVDDSVRTG
ncbi:MAG TPA: phosphoribosyltransferase, partial [Candidatus Synoicihabitans sp.]|nr:phosphoribosyltransferase [Candidatus Synoicihabitans sp.]